MVGEQIGLDEGAIFASLSDSVWFQETIKYRHNKDGLVTSQKTNRLNITGSLLLLLVTAAGIGVALDQIDEIKDAVDLRGLIAKIVWPF